MSDPTPRIHEYLTKLFGEADLPKMGREMRAYWKKSQSVGAAIHPDLTRAVEALKKQHNIILQLRLFLNRLRLKTIHEEEVLADIRKQIDDATNVVDECVATEHRLTDHYKNTGAHISSAAIERYSSSAAIVRDPRGEKRRKIQKAIEDVQEHTLLKKVKLAQETTWKTIASTCRPQIENETSQTLTLQAMPVAAKHSIQAYHQAAQRWADYVKEERVKLYKRVEEVNEQLLRAIDDPSAPSPSAEPVPKAPYEIGYAKVLAKGSPPPGAVHPTESKLRNELTNLEARLYALGDQKTIQSGPYPTADADIFHAVGRNPEMVLATHMAKRAETTRAQLKKTEKGAIDALNKKQQEMYNSMCSGPTPGALGPSLSPSDEAERISRARGPYDILQVSRDCNEADIRSAHAWRVKWFHADKAGDMLVDNHTPHSICTRLNTARDELINEETRREYTERRPLSHNDTELQRNDAELQNIYNLDLNKTRQRILDALMAPTFAHIPPSGLQTKWVLSAKTTARIKGTAAFDLLRSPQLKAIAFNLADYDRLLDASREGKQREKVRAATVSLRMPDPEHEALVFEVPVEVFMVTSDRLAPELPELARQVASLAEESMSALRCYYTERVSPQEDSSRRSRLPAFLAEWEQWRRDQCSKGAPVRSAECAPAGAEHEDGRADGRADEGTGLLLTHAGPAGVVG